MPVAKGHTNNPFGRKKGVRNKVHNDDKVFWQRLLKRNRKKIQADLDKVTANERLTFIAKMAAQIMPRESSIDLFTQVDAMPEEQLEKILNVIMKRNGKS